MRDRRSWYAIAALAAVAAAAHGLATAPFKTAQFDVVSLMQGQGGQVTVTSKVWVKGKKARVEVRHPLMGDLNVIADGRYIYQISPSQNQATKTDQAKATGGREPWQMFVANVEQLRQGARKVGAESLEGYRCDVYEQRESGKGQSASLRAWITRSLQPPMPLKVVRQVTIERPNAKISQTLTIRLRHLRLDAPLPDSLFTLPKGVRVVEGQPAMPNPGAMTPGMGLPGGGGLRGSH
jgi:outer membrane lipoprotein-sorting protein